MIELKILCENRKNGQFIGEYGLSILVNAFGEEFLFDTGYENVFITNSKLMDIDVDEINKIVLTHGHSDHSTGLKYLSNGKTIIMHPSAYKQRWSISRKDFAGFPLTEKQLKKKHNVIETDSAFQFYKNCLFLGEIPMIVDFEKDGNFATSIDSELTQIDQTEDDSGVVITTKQGLFIMTGCGHRGICNVIEQAKKVTGINKVYGLLGGFHLIDLYKQQEKVDSTIEYLKQLNIQELYLGHCITDQVIDYFKEKLKNVKIKNLAAGKEFKLNLQPLEN